MKNSKTSKIKNSKKTSNEKYRTRGKNAKMLRRLKQNLNEGVRSYLRKKDTEQETRIAKSLLKISELATLRYDWNKYSGSSIDIDDIQGEIIAQLWGLICRRKINVQRLKNENSMYNFFMMSANNRAKYEIRKHLSRKIKFSSLEQIMAMREGDFICEDFFRSDKIIKNK